MDGLLYNIRWTMSLSNRSRTSSLGQELPQKCTGDAPVASKPATPGVILDFYRRSLNDRPRITNAVVSMMISTTADTVAQSFEQWNAHGPWRGLDLHRTQALALTAFTYNGFILTSWLMFVNSAVPGNGTKAVLKKLAVTQAILQPFVYVPFFFVFHGFLMGQSSHDIMNRFSNDYFSLLFRLWSLFMPTRLLMFLVVPPQYQVLWDSSVSFFWQVALSLFDAAHGAKAHSVIQLVADMDPFGDMDIGSLEVGTVMTHVHHEGVNIGG